MFHLEALAERLPLTSIFQNMTFIHYVQGLANVTKFAKFYFPVYINCRLEANCYNDIRSDHDNLKALETSRQSLMRGIIRQNIQGEIKLVY